MTLEEQKPADKVEPKFKVKYAGSEYNVLETKNIADVTFYGIEDEPNHIDYVQAENCERVDGYSIKESGSPFPTKPAKFSEQKSAWSEEDVRNIQDIDSLLFYDKNLPEDTRIRLRNWLKSLKDRVQPQSKQEWNEEDEKVLDGVITNYESGYLPSVEKRDEIIEKLKSLKERYTWKPSDEQMKALEHAINCYSGISPTNTEEVYTLEIMKEQLKKLREE